MRLMIIICRIFCKSHARSLSVSQLIWLSCLLYLAGWLLSSNTVICNTDAGADFQSSDQGSFLSQWAVMHLLVIRCMTSWYHLIRTQSKSSDILLDKQAAIICSIKYHFPCKKLRLIRSNGALHDGELGDGDNQYSEANEQLKLQCFYSAIRK